MLQRLATSHELCMFEMLCLHLHPMTKCYWCVSHFSFGHVESWKFDVGRWYASWSSRWCQQQHRCIYTIISMDGSTCGWWDHCSIVVLCCGSCQDQVWRERLVGVHFCVIFHGSWWKQFFTCPCQGDRWEEVRCFEAWSGVTWFPFGITSIHETIADVFVFFSKNIVMICLGMFWNKSTCLKYWSWVGHYRDDHQSSIVVIFIYFFIPSLWIWYWYWHSINQPINQSIMNHQNHHVITLTSVHWPHYTHMFH